jgi:transglutaminase-like putative cysteine protease
MLLKITHQTDLKYSDLISESNVELRMVPRQGQDQHRLSFDLAIGPATSVGSYFDWLGNTVHTFSINAFHHETRIVATSVVETDRTIIDPQNLGDTWPLSYDDDYTLYDYLTFGGPIVDTPQLRQVVDSWPIPETAYNYSIYDYLQFGGPIVDCPQLRQLAQVLAPQPGTSLGELALQMLYLIDDKFTYKKGITNAASPITDILSTGYGVCQDFAHLFIGLARALKIPARYISGFLHPDAERFRGYTQTHAWCELLFPSAGWIGFDAANRCVVGGNFVKVGVGRSFLDVPPNRGIYRGNAEETINVAVKSEELPYVPPELAAERMQSIEVPVYNRGHHAHHGEIANQQEHQQQQQKIPAPKL